jgi:ubiquinone biosynthesis UbiH/UbiF/VisC/COQ6 family hydroxylase
MAAKSQPQSKDQSAEKITSIDSRKAAIKKPDVVIIGAGPAGLSLACSLADSGLSITIIDKQCKVQVAEPAMDGRDIAMTHLSKTILTELGVWQRFSDESVHPLFEATVQNGNSPYALHFERSDDPDAPLGYLVANHCIREALFQQASSQENIEWLFEKSVVRVATDNRCGQVELDDETLLEAPLIVSADSRFSTSRRMMGIGARMKDFGRVMIVCNMTHPVSHRNTAQECFHYGRTCAILPLGENTSSIVITVPASQADKLTSLPPEGFAKEAERMLDGRLGSMTLVNERFSYPLVGAYADKFVAQRYALIGDAAVGMHPVTAHGYNLGLRSADSLAKQLLKAKQVRKDIGGQSVLQGYQWRHQLLAKPLYESTNLIVRLYTDDRPVAKLVRKLGVRVGNNLAPFKKLVTHRLTQIR